MESPREAPALVAIVSISDRVVCPYTSGSRDPRRLRLGPLMTYTIWLTGWSPDDNKREAAKARSLAKDVYHSSLNGKNYVYHTGGGRKS